MKLIGLILKPNRIITKILVAALLLWAFTTAGRAESEHPSLRIVTTIFPLYDWARQVGGTNVHVFQLLPPGIDVHTYSLKPSDLPKIRATDLFIYLGHNLEPWATRIIENFNLSEKQVLRASDYVSVLRVHEDNHGAHESEGHEHNVDPHIWLDPIYARMVVRALADRLSNLDPLRENEYRANAAEYERELDQLHRTITQTLATCTRTSLVYVGHAAFRYFTARYGVAFLSPYTGTSPESSTSPNSLATLLHGLAQDKVPVIFYNEQESPRIAQLLAAELNVPADTLSTIHNPGLERRAQGVSYLGLMYENLSKIRKALDCP